MASKALLYLTLRTSHHQDYRSQHEHKKHASILSTYQRCALSYSMRKVGRDHSCWRSTNDTLPAFGVIQS